jgi:hypothetical protein
LQRFPCKNMSSTSEEARSDEGTAGARADIVLKIIEITGGISPEAALDQSVLVNRQVGAGLGDEVSGVLTDLLPMVAKVPRHERGTSSHGTCIFAVATLSWLMNGVETHLLPQGVGDTIIRCRIRKDLKIGLASMQVRVDDFQRIRH